MSDVKVTYFNGRGLAETIRYLLTYGNIDFEDVRIERDDWPALKPSTPFGQMPLYEEKGKVIGQSIAIARYLAKKVNLTGDNDWENMEIDALGDTLTDLRISKRNRNNYYLHLHSLKQLFINIRTYPYIGCHAQVLIVTDDAPAKQKSTLMRNYTSSVVVEELHVDFIAMLKLENP